MSQGVGVQEQTLEPKKTFLDHPVVGWVTTFLIIYSVLCFSLETMPSFVAKFGQVLYYSEVVIVAVFTFEYLARLYYAPEKRKFIFSFYGMVDLLSILPFYLSLVVDLRALRVLRLLRLIQLLKLARYSSAMQRFGQAISKSKEELLVFTAASFGLIYLAAVGIYQFEHVAQPDKFETLFDCIWWAVASLTTVGYGDIYPITIGGRVFTVFVLMMGLGLIAVPTGIIASALASIRNEETTEDGDTEPADASAPIVRCSCPHCGTNMIIEKGGS